MNALDPARLEALAKARWDADFHPAMADDREWSDLSEDDPIRRTYLRKTAALAPLIATWLGEAKAEALREAALDLRLPEHEWAGDFGTIQWLETRAAAMGVPL